MKRALSNLFIGLAVAGGTLGAGWAGTKFGAYVSDPVPDTGSLDCSNLTGLATGDVQLCAKNSFAKEARKNNIIAGGFFGGYLGLVVTALPVVIKDEIRKAEERSRRRPAL